MGSVQTQEHYDYNPDTAKKLLAEAGWDTSQTVTVSALPIGSETERAIRAALQSQLQAVGVQTNWEELEASVWAKKFYQDHQHDMVYIPATNFVDPACSWTSTTPPRARTAPGMPIQTSTR